MTPRPAINPGPAVTYTVAEALERGILRPGLEAAELIIGRPCELTTWREVPELRRTFLGGSDAAAAIGIDPYRSPVALWLEKLGRVDGFAGNNATEWGRRLEPVVADWLADTHPELTLIDPGERTWRHPERPWQACTPDRLALDPDRAGFGLVQIKTAGWRAGAAWEAGDAPDTYRAQVLHEMTVTGAAWGLLVCLVGGRDPYVVDVALDAQVADAITAAEARFWAHVEAGVEPPLAGHPDEAGDLARVFDHPDPAAVVDLDGTAAGDALAELVAVRADLDRLEATAGRLRAAVELELGNAVEGRLDGRRAVTWAPRTELDVDRLTADHPDAYADALRPRLDPAVLKRLRPDLAAEYRRHAGRTFRVTLTATQEAPE
jgi:putative phage-type endonuclease